MRNMNISIITHSNTYSYTYIPKDEPELKDTNEVPLYYHHILYITILLLQLPLLLLPLLPLPPVLPPIPQSTTTTTTTKITSTTITTHNSVVLFTDELPTYILDKLPLECVEG